MKTWKRGRKPATPEQLKEAKEWQRVRVKITNIVSRDETIERKCCICGKEEAPILHNKENPYYITFLCSECRKNKDNVEKAEQYRFNLEDYKQEQLENRDDNRYLDTRKFTEEEVKEIIDGYIAPSNTLTMGEYAEEHNISRYQFNELVKLYSKYFNRRGIGKVVTNRSKTIQKIKLSDAANDRNMAQQSKNHN